MNLKKEILFINVIGGSKYNFDGDMTTHLFIYGCGEGTQYTILLLRMHDDILFYFERRIYIYI